MNRLCIFLAVLGCVLFISCANTKPFEKAEHQKIQKGKTTYAEIVKLFGEPKSTLRGSNGKKVAVYTQFEMNPSAEALFFGSIVKNQGDVELSRLDILFDSKDRVENYHFSKTATDVTGSFDRASVGKAVTPEKVAKIKKGVTRKGDLAVLLGAPNEEGLSTEGGIIQYWWYIEQNMLDNDQIQTLVVVLKKDVVEDFAISKQTPDAD